MNNPPSVLVVDDEPLIGLLVADWLGELGYGVVGPVGQAGEAMAHLDRDAADAVLLDVSLGAGDSFQLADKAREKGLALAFITGRSALDLPQRFQGVPVLAKPFDFAAMETLMGSLLNGSPSVRAQSDT